MYEALIQNLRNIDEYDTGYAKLIYDAADAIEKLQEDSVPIDDMEMILSEVAKPRWIPVTERLPKSGERVLCLRISHFKRLYPYVSIFTERGFIGNDYTYLLPSEVTHWMPIPEPPKEE